MAPACAAEEVAIVSEKTLSISRNYKIYIIFACSYVFSVIVLNRWILTSLKLKSFGLVWQYYVSWADFGFFRRGLLGTLLTQSGLNKTTSNEYVFSYAFYGATLTACYYLLLRVLTSRVISRHRNIVAFCVLFSPATLSHFAYSTGCQDLILFTILLIGLFVVENAVALSVVVVAGVLIHELFVFLLPCIFVLKFVTSPAQRSWHDWRFVIPGLAALGAMVIVVFFGQVSVPRSEFENVMAARIPLAAYQHALWSGYFQVSSGIESNAASSIGMIKSLADVGYSMIFIAAPTIYAIYVALIVSAFSSMGIKRSLLLSLSILFPIAATIVAADYYRWTSLSACLGLVSMILLLAKGMLSLPRWSFVPLICFSILAPFGAAELERPFPLHQYLWEAVTRSGQ
jgi:hypothetical protein